MWLDIKKAFGNLFSHFRPIKKHAAVIPSVPSIIENSNLDQNVQLDKIKKLQAQEDPTQEDFKNTITSKTYELSATQKKLSPSEKIENSKIIKKILITAIRDGNEECIKSYLNDENRIFDINSIIDDEGNNLLHMASSFGNINIIRMLIAEGIDPNSANYFGQTSIHLAAIIDLSDVILELLKNPNIRLEVRDKQNRSPLEESIEYKSWNALSALLGNAKYVSVNVEGDGSCFFHAVARQLSIRGKEISSLELRQKAIDYILRNPQEFHGFLAIDAQDSSGKIYNNLDQYIDEMMQTHTWADNIIMQAIAEALNLNINIMTEREIIPISAINPEYSIVLHYVNGNHYRSIEACVEFLNQNLSTYQTYNPNSDAESYHSNPNTSNYELYQNYKQNSFIGEVKAMIESQIFMDS